MHQNGRPDGGVSRKMISDEIRCRTVPPIIKVRHAPREQVHEVTTVVVSDNIIIQSLVSKLPAIDDNIVRHGS